MCEEGERNPRKNQREVTNGRDGIFPKTLFGMSGIFFDLNLWKSPSERSEQAKQPSPKPRTSTTGGQSGCYILYHIVTQISPQENNMSNKPTIVNGSLCVTGERRIRSWPGWILRLFLKYQCGGTFKWELISFVNASSRQILSLWKGLNCWLVGVSWATVWVKCARKSGDFGYCSESFHTGTTIVHVWRGLATTNSVCCDGWLTHPQVIVPFLYAYVVWITQRTDWPVAGRGSCFPRSHHFWPWDIVRRLWPRPRNLTTQKCLQELSLSDS